MSALLSDPPGCPDWASVTILTMSLLTWEAVFLSFSIFAIKMMFSVFLFS